MGYTNIFGTKHALYQHIKNKTWVAPTYQEQNLSCANTSDTNTCYNRVLSINKALIHLRQPGGHVPSINLTTYLQTQTTRRQNRSWSRNEEEILVAMLQAGRWVYNNAALTHDTKLRFDSKHQTTTAYAWSSNTTFSKTSTFFSASVRVYNMLV